MVRILIGALVGGIILFVWGFVSWVILDWHKTGGYRLPDEPAVVGAMKATAVETGVYWIPAPEHKGDQPKSEQVAAMEDWKRRHTEGPRALVVYRTDGTNPGDPKIYLIGFAIDLLSALVACLMLAAAGLRGYLGRLLFVGGFGVLVALFADGTAWNFMHFPRDWTIVMMADRLIGWLLAGAALAAIVRPRRA